MEHRPLEGLGRVQPPNRPLRRPGCRLDNQGLRSCCTRRHTSNRVRHLRVCWSLDPHLRAGPALGPAPSAREEQRLLALSSLPEPGSGGEMCGTRKVRRRGRSMRSQRPRQRSRRRASQYVVGGSVASALWCWRHWSCRYTRLSVPHPAPRLGAPSFTLTSRERRFDAPAQPHA